MKNFLRLAQGINMTPLMVQIQRQPELWKADTYLRDYPQGPFNDVETIFLRFPPASLSELERGTKDQHECAWMDGTLHLPASRGLIFNLMTTVEGERLGRVMLNKIRPGGRIFPHADTPVHADYWDRFHYVVQSTPGVDFRCGDERVQMATGEVWWFQNAIEHEVFNNSAGDRIHLIIDIRTQHLSFKGELPTQPV
ncbi:MAG TPA: aspartyl/asparaginyl beta-hydroxylase domain-containing protein [Candidatus Acidoferrales bacterium]|nr:aspartyl/asparaginyl beta-hydroxylase domain-containing protein [Candidatus Acidoferrales bacterium]